MPATSPQTPRARWTCDNCGTANGKKVECCRTCGLRGGAPPPAPSKPAAAGGVNTSPVSPSREPGENLLLLESQESHYTPLRPLPRTGGGRSGAGTEARASLSPRKGKGKGTPPTATAAVAAVTTADGKNDGAKGRPSPKARADPAQSGDESDFSFEGGAGGRGAASDGNDDDDVVTRRGKGKAPEDTGKKKLSPSATAAAKRKRGAGTRAGDHIFDSDGGGSGSDSAVKGTRDAKRRKTTAKPTHSPSKGGTRQPPAVKGEAAKGKGTGKGRAGRRGRDDDSSVTASGGSDDDSGTEDGSAVFCDTDEDDGDASSSMDEESSATVARSTPVNKRAKKAAGKKAGKKPGGKVGQGASTHGAPRSGAGGPAKNAGSGVSGGDTAMEPQETQGPSTICAHGTLAPSPSHTNPDGWSYTCDGCGKAGRARERFYVCTANADCGHAMCKACYAAAPKDVELRAEGKGDAPAPAPVAQKKTPSPAAAEEKTAPRGTKGKNKGSAESAAATSKAAATPSPAPTASPGDPSGTSTPASANGSASATPPAGAKARASLGGRTYGTRLPTRLSAGARPATPTTGGARLLGGSASSLPKPRLRCGLSKPPPRPDD